MYTSSSWTGPSCLMMKSNTTGLRAYTVLKAQEWLIPQIKENEVPWWSKQVKTAVRIKQSAFKKFKTTNLSVDYDSYKVCRNKAKDVMHQARLNYNSQLIADNTRRFYSYIRRRKL